MGAFEPSKVQMMGEFELFGPVRGNLNKNVQKIKMPGGSPRGRDVEASISLVHYLTYRGWSKTTLRILRSLAQCFRDLNREANFPSVRSTSKNCLGHDWEHFLLSRQSIRQRFTEEAELPYT